MHRSSKSFASTLLLALVCAQAQSCTDPGAETPPGTADASRDAFGPLPETVAGYPVSQGAAPGYVPDEACADCHADLYASYQSVGMARSFYPPAPDKDVEEFGRVFRQEATGFHYEMHARDGSYFQERYCVDDQGRRFARHEEEVHWVVGSGNHARTYLAQNPHGELYELPMSWYADAGWGMSPGFEGPDHERFERRLERQCMFCHNAYPDVPAGNDAPGAPPTFPRDLPHGLGCQRCHGPGARHIEWAEDPVDPSAPRIFSPKDPAAAENLCMTCHLQPDVWSGGESILHAMDRATYAHRPDQPVTDHMSYFDFGTADERTAKIEINHHAYRLRQSKCYLESEGAMTCVTCHDPHAKAPAEELAAYHARKCQTCHQLDDCQVEAMAIPTGAQPTDCIACHMFEARPRDVVEVTITDHLIRRHPPERDLTAKRPVEERPTQPEAIAYLHDLGPGGEALEMYAAWACGDRRSRGRIGRWRAALDAAPPDHPYAYVTLGRAMAVAGDAHGSVEVLSAGVQRFPQDAALLFNLALSLHLAGRQPEAMEQVEQALVHGPTPEALTLRGNLHAILRRPDAARVDYEESLRLRPNSTKTWKAYASILAELGDLDASADAYSKALALSPDDVGLYLVLRDIYRAQGLLSEAIRILEHGASRSLDLRLELVLAWLVDLPEMRNPPKALDLAARAAADEPDDGRVAAHLALAMILNDLPDPVTAVIERAAQLNADAASCTGLQILEHLRFGNRAAGVALVPQFERQLAAGHQDRLRGAVVPLVQAALR